MKVKILRYIVSQLTDVSAYIGLTIILFGILAPRFWIVVLGGLLIATNDEWLKALAAKLAPNLAKKIDAWKNK